MKKVQLSLVDSYVSHWDWWEGIRELFQNAVDTKDYDVDFGFTSITITTWGGKIPHSALLLGESGKREDSDSIGKFGEGMKLAFLVLKRLGADVKVHNHDEIWEPCFEYSDLFDRNCLTVNITESEDIGEVVIVIDKIPHEEVVKAYSRFLTTDQEVVHTGSNGSALYKEEDDPCILYVNGIYVTELEGQYKFSYNFKPEYLDLDRDRNSVSEFNLRWEASRLLLAAGEFLLVADLAAQGYDDVEHVKYHDVYISSDVRSQMEDRALTMFYETYGENAWPINDTWSNAKKLLVSKTVAEKGYVPVEVRDALYTLVENRFKLDDKIKEILGFKPLDFLSKFLEENKRHMRSKPVRQLKTVIKSLKILEGK